MSAMPQESFPSADEPPRPIVDTPTPWPIYNETYRNYVGAIGDDFVKHLEAADDLPSQFGSQGRKTLNNQAFDFLRQRSEAFKNDLGPDFQPTQVILPDGFIIGNRNAFHRRIDDQSADNFLYKNIYPRFAERYRYRFPEVAFAMRLHESLRQTATATTRWKHEHLVQAALDSLTVYGMSFKALNKIHAGNLSRSHPHIIQDR